MSPANDDVERRRRWYSRRGRSFPSKMKRTKGKLASSNRRMNTDSTEGEREWWWRCEERLFSPDIILPFHLVSWSRSSCCFSAFPPLHLNITLCFPSTTICSHVRLWGYDGVRQHRGADRAGRGEWYPDDLRSLWQERSACQSALTAATWPSGPAGQPVDDGDAEKPRTLHNLWSVVL